MNDTPENALRECTSLLDTARKYVRNDAAKKWGVVENNKGGKSVLTLEYEPALVFDTYIIYYTLHSLVDSCKLWWIIVQNKNCTTVILIIIIIIIIYFVFMLYFFI